MFFCRIQNFSYFYALSQRELVMEDGKYLNAAQRELLVPKAYNAALRAGAAILDVYKGEKDYGVDLKRDLTPITRADRQAHAVIKE